MRKAAEQKSFLLMVLRAFLRVETHQLQTGITWYGKSHTSFAMQFELIWLGSSSVHARFKRVSPN
ncbi:MAG: hypothetical protein JW878_04080 [Methanomicrobia archaeon]|nr:hypothetical protein [Methanomicrobia archaeon]